MWGVARNLVLLSILIMLWTWPVGVDAAGTNLYTVQEQRVIQETEALLDISLAMVHEAESSLENGWSGMSAQDRRDFKSIFEPCGSGEIDDAFVEEVRHNYVRLQHRMERPLLMIYESDSKYCLDQRLYYTDLLALHICSYFTEEQDDLRKARGIIHETAHMTLLVMDRPYYRPHTHSSRYASLSPRGSFAAQLPILGPVWREVERNDTLYHPDAYAWYARSVFVRSRIVVRRPVQIGLDSRMVGWIPERPSARCFL